jgi:hypothetical protein
MYGDPTLANREKCKRRRAAVENQRALADLSTRRELATLAIDGVPSDGSACFRALYEGRRHLFMQPALELAPCECLLTVLEFIVHRSFDDEPRFRPVCFGGLRDTDLRHAMNVAHA